MNNWKLYVNDGFFYKVLFFIFLNEIYNFVVFGYDVEEEFFKIV